MDLALSGLASGFDWKSVVNQLTDLERAPQRRLKSEQLKLNERKNAVSSLITELTNLRTKTADLTKSSFFQGGGTATTSDDTVATASAGANAATGSFKFKIYQLATASIMKGGAGNGGAGMTGAVSPSTAMSDTSAGFAVPVSSGTFSISVVKSDGSNVTKQFTVDSTTTLDGILSSITSDADLELDATYDSATDKVTIANEGAGTVTEILLGASNDTSNFFDAVRLRPNGTNSITSSNAVGGANLSSTLSSLNFSNTGDALTDGSFKVNGVSISYTTGDTLSEVLSSINGSSAGVSAYYDAVEDRIVLTNKATGATGISLEDTSGNLLKKLNLVSSANNGNAGGTLTAGNDLLYTLNDGSQLRSKSNSITSESSGLSGVTVTALKAGSPAEVTITVGPDNSKIKETLKSWAEQYNKVQSLIETQVASSTDAEGKVNSGLLASDTTVVRIPSELRQLITTTPDIADLTEVKRLESIGYKTGGFDNKLNLSDESALDSALSKNLSQIEKLFTDSDAGIAVKLDSYLDSLLGDPDDADRTGSLVNHRDAFAKQSSSIDEQMKQMEKQVQVTRQRLVDNFIAMERAQAKINQQMQYLAQRFK